MKTALTRLTCGRVFIRISTARFEVSSRSGEQEMTTPVSVQSFTPTVAAGQTKPEPLGEKSEPSEIGKRFEQMLWTEMLTYAGLDKAFAQGGGQAAETFSRYVVESIAADLSKAHPMGLGEAVDRSIAAHQQPQQDDVI
jgi:hypothetical protein